MRRVIGAVGPRGRKKTGGPCRVGLRHAGRGPARPESFFGRQLESVEVRSGAAGDLGAGAVVAPAELTSEGMELSLVVIEADVGTAGVTGRVELLLHGRGAVEPGGHPSVELAMALEKQKQAHREQGDHAVERPMEDVER